MSENTDNMKKGKFFMDFKTAVETVLKKNYANFNGRARRSEFWYYYLFTFVLGIVLSIITTILGGVPVLGTILKIVIWLIDIALIIPGIAVGFRRLHDTGKSGLWILINFVPLVGSIIYIVFCVQDSQPGENQYGACPK